MKFLFVILFYLFPLFSNSQNFSVKVVPESLTKVVMPNSVDFNNVKKSYPKAVKVVDYLPKNYVQNGSVDYTKYVQKAIDDNSNIIMPNFPVLISSIGLTIKSNSVIIFDIKSKIKLKPTSNPNYQVLRVYNVNNVKIYFANISGDKYSHLSKGGEFGMGISIRGSQYITIYKSFVEKCWGDGLYIDDYSKNITINGLHVDNNRRNGVSIVYGSNIIINNLLASNTYGTAPMAGIDIEPDNNSQVVDNISLNNPITYNNSNRGILIVLTNLPGNSKRQVNINVNNHIDYYSKNGFAFYPGSKDKNWKNLSGNINIINSDWSKSILNPIFIPSGIIPNNIVVDISQSKSGNINTMNKIKANVRDISNVKIK